MPCPKTSIFSVFQKLMLSSFPYWNEAESNLWRKKNKDFLIVPNFHFSQSGVKVSGIEQQRVADYWSSFFSQQIAGTGKAAMNKDHGLVYRWLLYDLLSVYKSLLFSVQTCHWHHPTLKFTYQVFHLPFWPIGEEKRRRNVCYQSLLPRDL